MRRVRDLSWLGILVAMPIAVGHAQAPEAASGKGKTKQPSAAPAAPVTAAAPAAQAAPAPKPAQLETPPWAADEAVKPGAAANKPAAATDKPARASADKPNKAGTPTAAAEPASAQKAKTKRPSKAESELASARTAPAAPPAPPPPAAAPKPVAPQPAAAPKPAGPNCTLEEAEQPRGGRLDVLGNGFGQSPVVRIAARPARMIERRTDRISVQVPADSDGGAVTLQSEGQSASCGNLVIIGKNR